MLKKIDHVGIAVQSVDTVKMLFKTLFNLEPLFEETVEAQKVRVVGFRVGESTIEYLEPTARDAPISKFLAKRGEGLHHIALGVSDLDRMLRTMKMHGIQLIDETPKIGAAGKKIAFVHPGSMNGVLLELSEE